MKINQLFLLTLLVLLAGTSLVSAEKIYILFEPGCMDRLEYQYTRTDGRSDYFVYHVNVRSGEKLILEVGEESSNEQNYIPTPYLSCANGGFDQSLMRRINANIDEVFVVYPKNNRSYTVSPVAIASYYTKNGGVITYESPKYRFRFDSNYGTIGENIAYNNPGVKLYFEGQVTNDCEGSYLFRQLSPQSAYPLINLVLTPEIGIVEESSGPNAAAAETNKISLNRVNDINLNRYMREVCGTEPGSRRSVAAGNTPTQYFNPTPTGNNPNLPAGAVSIGNSSLMTEKTPVPTGGEPTQSSASTHTVASGETLYGISRKYGVSVNDIKDWNNLNSNMIRRGQVLTVAAPSAADNAASASFVPNQAVTPATASTSLPVPYNSGAANSDLTAKSVAQQHVVQPGETVASLALQYGYTEKRFREMNDMGPNDYIKVGQRLRTTDCDCPSTTTKAATVETASGSVPMSYSSNGGGRIVPNSVYSANSTTTSNAVMSRGVPQSNQVPVTYATSTPNLSSNNQNSSYDSGAIVPQAYDATPARTNMSNLESGNRAIMPANRNNYSTPVNPQPSSGFNNDIFGSGNADPAPSSYNAFQYPDSYYQSSRTPAASSTNAAPANQRRVHIVQEGESLYGIARQYNTTPERLRQLNSLGSTSTITAYQTLYIE